MPEAERLADGGQVGCFDEQFHAQLLQASGNCEMARVHREITAQSKLEVRHITLDMLYRARQRED